jgi:hypothetical protein
MPGLIHDSNHVAHQQVSTATNVTSTTSDPLLAQPKTARDRANTARLSEAPTSSSSVVGHRFRDTATYFDVGVDTQHQWRVGALRASTRFGLLASPLPFPFRHGKGMVST